MVNFIDTLLVLIFFLMGWLIYTIPFLAYIRLEAKSKLNKNEEIYPYFHYPLFKKLFLLGLKGAVNTIVVVITFVFNISIMIFSIVSIWQLIAPNIYISYCCRALAGIYLVSLMLKLFFLWAFPPKF